ncbi:hypothetical protein AGDE_16400 [Angomonas deanei]|uniref:Uncharacterized protein n=1 Tax=Angomonas deanei TaxID=59799 RepID=A0A7G2C7T1_9TRYP|nr:hypothetical protein AGDE_16400 [Angomonas deanei]CAD2215164.1 hypothetical protein, conserved [Angomonas deanei]|eukprot:EPY17154.1 hypothetical protein AGDE_16400 [Angomonas deanei]
MAASATPAKGLVLTVEAGGWLRVREVQGGLIRHQQQLPGREEGTSLSWLELAGRSFLVVGCLSGRLQLLEWGGESVSWRLEATATDATPLVQLVSLSGEWMVSLDVRGRLRCWHLTDGPLDLTEERVVLTEDSVIAGAEVASPMSLVLSGTCAELLEGQSPAAAHLLRWSTHSKAWRVTRYYGSLEEEPTRVTALCTVRPGQQAPQLWAGTARGTVWCWELRTGRPLHHLRLPTESLVHALCPATGGERELSVWSCQTDGRVTAYSPSFRLLECLPLSYPPTATTDHDQLDLYRARFQTSLTSHFSLFLWGCSRCACTASGPRRPTAQCGRGCCRVSPGRRRSRFCASEVKAFLQDKAASLVRLQETHAAEIKALQATVEQLRTEAQQYKEELQARESVPSRQREAAPPRKKSPSSHSTELPCHDDEVISIRTGSRSPSPQTELEALRTSVVRGLVEELGLRVEEHHHTLERQRQQLTAYQLHALEEAAALQDRQQQARQIAAGRRPRRPVPLRSPTPDHSPIRRAIEEEPIQLVSVYSSPTRGSRSEEWSPVHSQPFFNSYQTNRPPL